jgi:hypothetical protein
MNAAITCVSECSPQGALSERKSMRVEFDGEFVKKCVSVKRGDSTARDKYTFEAVARAWNRAINHC